MTLSHTQLQALLPEATPAVGGLIRKVWCGNDRLIVLEVRTKGQNHFILLSAEEGGQRLSTVTRKPAQPPAPPSFVMKLRKELTGARLLALGQLSDDRVVRLDFERRARPDDPEAAPSAPASITASLSATDEEDASPTTDAQRAPLIEADADAMTVETLRRILIAELTPMHSNLVLLNGDEAILAGLLNLPRALRHGQPYSPPPPPPASVLARHSLDPLTLASLPTDGQRSARVEAHYTHKLAWQDGQQVGRALLTRLKRALKRSARRVKAIEGDLQRVEDAGTFRRWGELLQSAYGKIPRGAQIAEVPDYYAEGMPTLSVPLDPRLDLQGNITEYFRRYRKYHDAEEQVLTRLEDAEADHARLEAALLEAAGLVWLATEGSLGHKPSEATAMDEALSDREVVQVARERADALRAWIARQEASGLLRPQQVQRARRGSQAGEGKALPYRSFTSRSGLSILVGKGGKHNDALSLKVARGNDLWLHARDWAGAHVVVRLDKGRSLDQETLLDAALLAAHYSKGRGDTLVDVQYTHAKHVRKPKGLPPGRVTVADGRNIAVRPDPERLTRLFNAR